MMDKHIYIFNTQTDLNQAVADHFAEIVNLSVKSRGVAYVAFSGGGTPQGFFQALAQPPYQTSLPWIDIHVYWVDERSVPVDHPESNFGARKDRSFYLQLKMRTVDYIILAFTILFMLASIYFAVMGFGKIPGLTRF